MFGEFSRYFILDNKYWTSKDFVERDQDSNCYTGYH